MKPEDLIEAGLIRGSDLDGDPGGPGAPELGPYGRYVLLEELGRGGAAIVYRALDPLLNRELALKRLRFGDLDLEMRFLREAELLARLSHAGIMPIFDFGHEGDSHYYTMPLARGLSLDRWILERRPDARESARILCQAAEALAHAHDRGVLHRDLKPANILVSAEGNALVADFGLGRIDDPRAAAERMTQSGEVMGTPSYMAPEFASGDLKGVDARCDVYGLGATLYEALTGRPPFTGRSSLEILKRVTTEEPVPPRRLAPDTPADLEIICLKALEKDPARRYATSRELADDLGRFLSGEPIRARRASPLYRLRRFAGRRRAIVAVALAGIAVAGGIAVYAALGAEDSASRRARATLHLDKADEFIRRIVQLLRNRSENDLEVRKEAAGAFERIDMALKEDPGSAQAHFLKGRTHSLLFERDLARASLDSALAIAPLPAALLERAILDGEDLIVELARIAPYQSKEAIRERRSRVVKDLERVMLVTLRDSDIGFAQALVKITREPPDWGGAATLLEAYLAESQDWRAHFWGGIAQSGAALEMEESRQSGSIKKAADSLKRALDLRSNCRATPRILERLSWAMFWLDEIEEATRLCEEAVRRDPESADLRYQFAVMLLEKPDFDGALREAQAALDRGPAQPDVRGILGMARAWRHEKNPELGAGELRRAKEDLEAALRFQEPGSPGHEDLTDALKYVEKSLPKSREY